MTNQASGVIIRGGHVIDPSQGRDELADVLIFQGQVWAIGAPADLELQAQELLRQGVRLETIHLESSHIVAPGFVDLHCHLREPGFEDKETIATGMQAAARGGFTTICCMPNTRPVLDSRATIEQVLAAAKDGPARVLPIAAITKGEEGKELTEMAELVGAGAIGFSDDGKGVASSKLLRSALEYSLLVKKPIIEHCEDRELAAGGVMNEGATATRLGLKGQPAAAEEVMLGRDIALVRLTGGRYHAAHVSTVGAVALIRQAKREGLPVTAEVTPHHLLLTDRWVAGERQGLFGADKTALPAGVRYDTHTKVNPPLRTQADCDALLAALDDGIIEAIATDHAPHTAVDKACEYDQAAFGITGFETALGVLLALVETKKISLSTLISRLSCDPARIFGLPGGVLALHAPADLVIFDPQAPWTVDPAAFASKGKNTPLSGVTLTGKVVYTILAGHIVYKSR